VNLGNDTDTTGCVAGGLAGLIYRKKGIPAEWLEVLVKREELDDLSKRFAAFCRQEPRTLSAPLSTT
jgi:ADP-ribosylglycohydrolase